MATAIPENRRQSPRSGIEEPKSFLPVPERVSQYLELKVGEVATQMMSEKGRENLYKKLLEHEDDIRKLYPDFNTSLLRTQLDEIGGTLAAKEAYMKEVQPKKGLFRRALEGVGGFAKRHPIVTALLALAAVSGTIAAGFYFTGNWELLVTTLGLNKISGFARTVGEVTPVTPKTPPLPGGGVYEVPPPLPGPGEFPDVPQ